MDIDAAKFVLEDKSLHPKIKLVSLNRESAYHSDITTDTFGDLYVMLNRLGNVPLIKLVAEMSVMDDDDQQESLSQERKRNLRPETLWPP